MAVVDARVSYLEAKMEDVGKTLTLLRSDISVLNQNLRGDIAGVNKKLDAILFALLGGMLAIVATLITKLR